MQIYHYGLSLLIVMSAIFAGACNGIQRDEAAIRDNLMVTAVNFAPSVATENPVQPTSSMNIMLPITGTDTSVCHVIPKDQTSVALLSLPVPGASAIDYITTQATVIHNIIGGYYVELPLAQGSTRGWVFMHSVDAINCAPDAETGA